MNFMAGGGASQGSEWSCCCKAVLCCAVLCYALCYDVLAVPH